MTNENEEVMQDDVTMMNIYEVKARVMGETADQLINYVLTEEDRKKKLEEVDKYLEFTAKQDREAFQSECRLRELDQKDRDLKMQNRRLIFDYIKLGASVAVSVGFAGVAIYTGIRDYQMQGEGYIPSTFGKICGKISDQLTRSICPKV